MRQLLHLNFPERSVQPSVKISETVTVDGEDVVMECFQIDVRKLIIILIDNNFGAIVIMKKQKKSKRFCFSFCNCCYSALSIMTTSMFFYYDNDLKSVSRNSVMQQVNLAAETGYKKVKNGLQIN